MAVRVKRIFPSERCGRMRILLDDGHEFDLTDGEIEKSKIIQGAEVEVVEDLPNVYISLNGETLDILEYI